MASSARNQGSDATGGGGAAPRVLCCRGGGADSRGTQCSVLGVVLRLLGQQRGRSSNRRRASPIDQCLRSSARERECGTLPPATVLPFSFFSPVLSEGTFLLRSDEAWEP
jgi:hypothetical protein